MMTTARHTCKAAAIRMQGYCCRLLTVLVLMAPHIVRGDEANAEVVDRCIQQIGEFGTEAIEVCVTQELAAQKALSGYPPEHKGTINRCTQRMQQGGWWMVKACVDQDIEATAALAHYAPAHKALIERCQKQVGEQGAAPVKACVELELGAKPR